MLCFLTHLVRIVDNVVGQDDQRVDPLLEIQEPRDVVRVRSRGIKLLRLEVLQGRLEDLLWSLRRQEVPISRTVVVKNDRSHCNLVLMRAPQPHFLSHSACYNYA